MSTPPTIQETDLETFITKTEPQLIRLAKQYNQGKQYKTFMLQVNGETRTFTPSQGSEYLEYLSSLSTTQSNPIYSISIDFLNNPIQ